MPVARHFSMQFTTHSGRAKHTYEHLQNKGHCVQFWSSCSPVWKARQSTHERPSVLLSIGLQSRVWIEYSLLGGVVAPGLVLFLLVVFTILAIEGLHGVADGLNLSLSLNLGLFSLGISLLGLLGLGVSVHEEIDDNFPIAITGNLTSELEDLAGHKPEAVSDGVTALVVGGDSNINPVEGGVGVGEGNHGDVHVGSLNQALVVKTGVADDDETGFKELLGVVIGEGTGNPLTTQVVGTSVGGELEDGTLSVLTGRNNLIKSKVIIIFSRVGQTQRLVPACKRAFSPCALKMSGEQLRRG
jgi:hypothetical protein